MPLPSVLDQVGGLLPQPATKTGSSTTSGTQQGSLSQSLSGALDGLGRGR